MLLKCKTIQIVRNDEKYIDKLFSEFKKLYDSDLDQYIDNVLWKLRFNPYTKGTLYLKIAILLCFIDNELLYNNQFLIYILSVEYNTSEKNIRNCIDNSLTSAFKYEYLDFDIKFFNGYYDGRKISLKYFILLIYKFITESKNINLK